MPIQKDLPVKGGYTANYHKIRLNHFDTVEAFGLLTVSTYKDVTEYTNSGGKNVVDNIEIKLEPAVFMDLAQRPTLDGETMYDAMSRILHTYLTEEHVESNGSDGPFRGGVVV